MTTSHRYDAIVVGARAAGAATALLLARQGRRVLAVDRAPLGADTVSTHALMKGGVLQLQRWGLLDRIVAAGTPPLRRTVVRYEDSSIEIPMDDEGDIDALYAPRRTVLDPILATAATDAGADVRFETTVTSVLRGAGGRVTGVAYRTPEGRPVEAHAPLTVGADGMRSLVARAVRAPVTHAGTHAGGTVYAYFAGGGVDGYQWYFRHRAGAGVVPTNGGLLVFVSLPSHRFATEVRPHVEPGFWRALRRLAPEVAAAIDPGARTSRFHLYPGTPGYHRRPGGPGWALVGDASHFKDPISAHGLTDALRDAELLTRAVGPALDDPATLATALAAYEAERDRLGLPLFHVVERVAAYDWSASEVRDLLVELSRCMAREVALLRSFESPVPARAA